MSRETVLNLYDKWCTIPDKIRFLFIGGVNAAFSYIIFAIAVYLIGQEHYQICVALQWAVSSVFSFVNQKVFVFCTKGHWLISWSITGVFPSHTALASHLSFNPYPSRIIKTVGFLLMNSLLFFSPSFF